MSKKLFNAGELKEAGYKAKVSTPSIP